MQYRRLTGTGLTLSAIAFGSWSTLGERVDDRGGVELLATAYELGINYFDCAETYADGRSEEAVGAALRRLAWPRETYVVSGKVFWGVHGKRPNTWGLSRKHVVEGCDATLRRLGLDHLDLYLCHRADEHTPLLETVSAMTELVRRGKVLYWGTSEWPSERVEEAVRLAGANGLIPPQVEQLQYNLAHRERVEREYAALRQRIDLGITTWSPLLYGLFAGRYDGGPPTGARLSDDRYAWLRDSALGDDPDGTLARVRAVNAFSRSRGVEPAQLALAWVLRNPDVTSAITGASSPAQLRESCGALDVTGLLDASVLRHLDDLLGFGERTGADQPRARQEAPS